MLLLQAHLIVAVIFGEFKMVLKSDHYYLVEILNGA